MKRCVGCTGLVDSAADKCPTCETTEFTPILPDADAALVITQADKVASQNAERTGKGQQSARTDDTKGKDDQAKTEGEKSEAKLPAIVTEVDDQPAEEGPPEQPGHDGRAAGPGEEFNFAADGTGAADQIGKVVESSEDVAKIKGEKIFIIGLLGFPTGGKTWFLNRLKRSYQQPSPGSPQYRRPACVPSPPAAREGSRVSRSNDITCHRFTVPSNDSLSFNLLDIPGERFQKAAEKNFVGVNKLMLTALEACDALIVVLPADEVLFAGEIADPDRCEILRALREKRPLPDVEGIGAPPTDNRGPADIQAEIARLKAKSRSKEENAAQRHDETMARLEEEYLERREWRLAEAAIDIEDFAANIGLFAGVVRLLEQGMSAGDLEALPDGASIMRRVASGKFERRSQPVFIALSKMDGVIKPEPMIAKLLDDIAIGDAQRQRLDVDPQWTLARCNPGIAHHAEGAFEWCKIDAVTAFGGHHGDDVIRYARCEVHGVDSLIEWIRWARSMSSASSWRRLDAWGARQIRRVRQFLLA